MGKVKIPVTVFNGNVTCANGKPLPQLQENSSAELVININNFCNAKELKYYSSVQKIELLPKNTEVFIAINPYYAHEKLDAISVKIKGLPNSYKSVFVNVVLNEPLCLLREGFTRSKLLECSCYIPIMGSKVYSLNQAYTAISKRYEVERSSFGGNVFKNCAVYNEKENSYQLLKTLRDNVLDEYEAALDE